MCGISYPGQGEASYRHAPPATYPFGALDNVVLSPHRTGALGEAEKEQKRMDALAEVLNALVEGVYPPGRVDMQRGH